MKFTDTIDASIIISLYEYGLIRNPKTDKTIICINHSDTEHTKLNPPVIKTAFISMEDVKEGLKDAGAAFYSFIGSSLETELESLDNACLSHTIHSLNMYDGFLNQFII